MLQALRKSSGGIVAKIFLGLLVLSFAVWGASDAFIGGAAGDAITVGETRVSPADLRFAYQTRLSALEQQFGQRLTREQARTFGIEQSVRNQMVAGAVLDESARKMGLGISEERLAALIGEDPTFRDISGRFSRERLNDVLRSIGMSEESYIRNREAVAVRNQIASAMTGGLEMPDAFFDAFARYQSERRVFDYVTITSADVPPPPAPTDAELAEFYEANKARYVAPEFRKVVLVRLTAQDIAKPDAIEPDAVSAEYEATKQKYGTPEQRRVQQLSFSDAQAAQSAAERLAGGESFEAIMAEQGKTATDVDLGMLAKSQIPDQNVAEAAFGLALNQPSGVVEGIFGPVILRVTEIAPESVRPLAEVEEEIRKDLALRKAVDELYDVHDRVEDERAAGETLASAAAKAGLTARTIERIDARGLGADGEPVADIPQASEVLKEVFETDEGVEADPVLIGADGFVWFEVAGVEPERQKPLDEVRAEIVDAWSEQKTAGAIEEKAQAVRDRVAKGEDMAAVAADLLAAPGATEAEPRVKQSAEMTRSDTGQDLPATAVEAGFSVPEGGVAVAPGPVQPSGIVLKVARVIDSSDVPVSQQLRERLDAQIADDLMANMVRDLQAREEVLVNQAAIDAALQY